MDYRREIDGLRALAVVPVIFFHAGFQAFSGGFVGVDVFFVVSGYLITTIILTELQIETFSIANFYERRARRILPALFLVLFVCLPFAWLWLLPQDMKSFSESLVAVSIFSSNVLFWRTSGYFDAAAELKPLLHTWSLAVEEQYYLFFPVFLVLTWRFGKRWILFLLAIAVVASLAAAQWGSISKPAATFYLLPTRAWELLAGAFAAFFLLRQNAVPQRTMVRECGAAIGFALVLYSIFAFDRQTPFPSLYTLAPVLGATLVILCADANTVIGKILGRKLLVGVGLISYSAYLWHQPLLALTKHRILDDLSNSVALMLVLVTFVLSYFSWKYVERPFRNRNLTSRAQVVQFGIAGSLFFIAFGLTGLFTRAFEPTVTNISVYEGDVGHLDFHKYVSDKYFKCTPESIAAEALVWAGFLRCMQSKNTADIDIALLGDSHAEHLFLGLADSLQHKNVAFYIKGSYSLLSNSDFDAIYKHVLNTKSIRSVLLTMHWVHRVNQIPKSTTLERELGNTVRALIDAGKTVYLLDDVPRFPFPPERCKYLAARFSRAICEVPTAQIRKYEKTYLAELEHVAAQFPSLHFLKISDLLCREVSCSMVKNGVLMYRDTNHLNILGSRYIGAEIAKHFPELDM